jgi:hypothetical protein
MSVAAQNTAAEFKRFKANVRRALPSECGDALHFLKLNFCTLIYRTECVWNGVSFRSEAFAQFPDSALEAKVSKLPGSCLTSLSTAVGIVNLEFGSYRNY